MIFIKHFHSATSLRFSIYDVIINFRQKKAHLKKCAIKHETLREIKASRKLRRRFIH